jgi:hypothetical protein
LESPDVLDYGADAAERVADVVLADDVIAHPLNKGRPRKGKPKTAKKRPTGRQAVIVANGFGGYASEQAEMEALDRGNWSPHSEDFHATATADVGDQAFAAGTDDEFIGAIEATSGTIGRVVFIGHGNARRLGLAGQREGSTTRFTSSIDSDTLDKWAETIRQRIVPRLHENATIDVVACDVGLGKPFMQKIADTFQRCVRASNGPIFWRDPRNDDRTKITTRGLTSSNDVDFTKGFKHLRFAITVCPTVSKD